MPETLLQEPEWTLGPEFAHWSESAGAKLELVPGPLAGLAADFVASSEQI